MQIVWELDNLQALADYRLNVSGQPTVIDGPYGKAIEFDGVQDALFVGSNPVAGWQALTVEVVFRPDAG